MTVDLRRVAIASCAICTFLNLYSTQSILPFIAAELGIGAARAGLIVTAGTAAVALTAPFTGAISDRLGRKRIILAAMTLLMLPTLMLAFSSSLEELVFWRFLQGLLLPPIFAVTIAYIGDEWPKAEAAAVVGIYSATSAIGGFLGRFIPGLLTEPFTWRGGFVAIAAANLVCVAVTWYLLPKEKQFVRATSLAASLRQMIRHLGNGRLVATYAVGFGVMFNFMATFTFISFHLAAPPFHRSAFFLGSIFVVYLAGSALAPWTGFFIARLGRRRFALIALALWTGGLALTLTPSLTLIVAGLLVASTTGILMQAISTGYVAVTAPAGTSAAVGLYVLFFYTGGTIGGWLPGIAYDSGGWPATAAMIFAMLGLMAAIVARFWRETSRSMAKSD
jgi:YNFM family putative membrane transporter